MLVVLAGDASAADAAPAPSPVPTRAVAATAARRNERRTVLTGAEGACRLKVTRGNVTVNLWPEVHACDLLARS
ncbi:hypothetical protein GCM10010346_19350 [Streptomyces chryseus]|uniref:Secreted protein n=1 Tax=Streptomyces chryseus TaxID=68186 RepID=A0ABQ3DHS5_9ACTN|nr:hypothetical protein GCM10010346_19350 [Streptomyces chryseus]